MTEHTEPGPDRLLRVPEVAERLSSSRGYVYRLMQLGRLPYVEMPSTRAHNPGAGMLGRRVKESELAKFIASHEVTTAATS